MQMRRTITSILLALTLLLLPLTDWAQQASPDKPQAPTPAQPAAPKQDPGQQSDQTIKKVVNLVDVLFTVLNRRNKLVPELEKGEFKIWDEKTPQEIRYFSRQTDLPLRIGMLLDTSNSIRDRIKFEQDASINFLFSVLRRNKDEAFVMTFDDEPQIVQAFTGRPAGRGAPRDDSDQRWRRQFIDAHTRRCHRNGPAHQRGHLHHQHQHAVGFALADRSEQDGGPQIPFDGRGQDSPGACGRNRGPSLFPVSRGRSGSIVPGYWRRTSQPIFHRLSSDELRPRWALPQNPHRSARPQGLPGARPPRLFRARQRQRSGDTDHSRRHYPIIRY